MSEYTVVPYEDVNSTVASRLKRKAFVVIAPDGHVLPGLFSEEEAYQLARVLNIRLLLQRGLEKRIQEEQQKQAEKSHSMEMDL